MSAGFDDERPLARLSAASRVVVEAARALRGKAYVRAHIPLLADLKAWAQRGFWTRDEAAALSFGLEPELFDQISKHQGDNPRWRSAMEWRETVRRASGRNMLANQVKPLRFLEWAQSVKADVPSDLLDAVKERHGTASRADALPAVASVLEPDLAVANAKISDLEKELATARAALKENELRDDSRTTYEMIIATMAIHAYRQKCAPARGQTARRIHTAMNLLLKETRAEGTVRDRISDAIKRQHDPVKLAKFNRYLTLAEVTKDLSDSD